MNVMLEPLLSLSRHLQFSKLDKFPSTSLHPLTSDTVETKIKATVLDRKIYLHDYSQVVSGFAVCLAEWGWASFGSV